MTRHFAPPRPTDPRRRPTAAPSWVGAAPAPPHTGWLQRAGRALARWWRRRWMDDMTAYLSQAENHVDLEYRIREWNDRAGRAGPWVR